MRNLRSYYSADLDKFLSQSTDEILGTIFSNNDHSETRLQQGNTWKQEIDILKNQFGKISNARIIFEYTIPRMGKRVDVIQPHQKMNNRQNPTV